MRDIFNAGHVKVMTDEFGKRIWVCVDGETVLRCARISTLEIEDNRVKLMPDGTYQSPDQFISQQHRRDTMGRMDQ